MIELDNVGLRYPKGETALKNITLTLEPGSLTFLTGHSGAGKSSLLKLLYFAQRPSSGRARILGRDASRVTRDQIAILRRKIGVVFQNFRLLDHLTVFENAALPLMVAGRREAEYRRIVLEMLDWVNLSDKLSERPTALSGGEKQCVAIARAMVTAPELILADEPTGSVDPDMGARIMGLLYEMQQQRRTVLIATHDVELVRYSRMPRLHLDNGEFTEWEVLD
ncbi:MAG: ATP-binding cassette domain-containing protein [Neomegalonema sp.]|nr:ATP-binding cassette domain-containing protein [Neomegalonema sp.]